MATSRYQQIWNKLADRTWNGLVSTLSQFTDDKTSIYNRGPLSKDISTLPVFYAREQLMETIADMRRERAGACLPPGGGSWTCLIVSAFCLCMPLCVAYCYDNACIPRQAEVDVVESLLDSIWNSVRIEQSLESSKNAIEQEVKNILTAFHNTLQLKLPENTRNKLLAIRASVASAHGIQIQDVVPFHKAQKMYAQDKKSMSVADEKTPLTQQTQYSPARMSN